MRSLILLLLVCWIDSSYLFASDSCKPIAAPVSFKKIETALEECGIGSIEELLALLPAEYRSRFVLVHSSRSLQGATPASPRVILFGLDAKFILAFSGDPNLKGIDSVETIEFDDQTKKFHFQSISFSTAEKSSGAVIKPTISSRNPELCKNCHRQELRPNWDTYSAWPGVFGSKDDGMPAAEKAAYQNFMQDTFQKIGRYRYLEDAEKYPDKTWYYDYFPSGRVNLQFTWLLSLLNSQAISREIKDSPKLKPFRYALLASLKCEDDFRNPETLAQLIPADVTSGFAKSYDMISTKVTNGIESSYRQREDRQVEVLASMDKNVPISNWEHKFKALEMCCAPATTRFLYILEGAGVPLPEWSLEFGSKNPVFFAGEVGEVGELGLFLWKELLDPEQDRDIYQIYQDAWDHRSERGQMVFSVETDELCSKLRKKSLATLSAN